MRNESLHSDLFQPGSDSSLLYSHPETKFPRDDSKNVTVCPGTETKQLAWLPPCPGTLCRRQSVATMLRNDEFWQRMEGFHGRVRQTPVFPGAGCVLLFGRQLPRYVSSLRET